jgi:hypothetical protein
MRLRGIEWHRYRQTDWGLGRSKRNLNALCGQPACSQAMEGCQTFKVSVRIQLEEFHTDPRPPVQVVAFVEGFDG